MASITSVTIRGRVYLDLKELVLLLRAYGWDAVADSLESGELSGR